MSAPIDFNPTDVADLAWDALARMYGQPGVKDTVLALQDNAGVCVTALLTLLWSAASGYGPASPATVRAIVTETEALESAVLRPYRQARNGLREHAATDRDAAAVRGRLLDQELELERYLQTRVLAILAPAATREPDVDPSAAVDRVLARYLEHCHMAGNQADTAVTRVLCNVALGDEAFRQ